MPRTSPCGSAVARWKSCSPPTGCGSSGWTRGGCASSRWCAPGPDAPGDLGGAFVDEQVDVSDGLRLREAQALRGAGLAEEALPRSDDDRVDLRVQGVDEVVLDRLAVHGLTPYRVSSDGRGALIFGYATLTECTIAEGIEILAK